MFFSLHCLEYEDGSVASLNYFAVGSKELPKEWLEVHFDEKSIIMDDYKSIKGCGVKQGKTREEAKNNLLEVIQIQFEEMSQIGALDEYLA